MADFYDIYEGFLEDRRRWRVALQERRDAAPAGGVQEIEFDQEELIVEIGNPGSDPVQARILPTRVQLRPVDDTGGAFYDFLASTPEDDLRVTLESTDGEYTWRLRAALQTLLKPRFLSQGPLALDLYAHCGLKKLEDQRSRLSGYGVDWSGWVAANLFSIQQRDIQHVVRVRATNAPASGPTVDDLRVPDEAFAGENADVLVSELLSGWAARLYMDGRNAAWRIEQLSLVGQSFTAADRVSQVRSAETGLLDLNDAPGEEADVGDGDFVIDLKDGRRESVREIVYETDLSWVSGSVNLVRGADFEDDVWFGDGTYTTNNDEVYAGQRSARLSPGTAFRQQLTALRSGDDVRVEVTGQAAVRVNDSPEGNRRARLQLKGTDEQSGDTWYWDGSAWVQSEAFLIVRDVYFGPDSNATFAESWSGYSEFTVQTTAPPFSGPLELAVAGETIDAAQQPYGRAYFDTVVARLIAAGSTDTETPNTLKQWKSAHAVSEAGKAVTVRRRMANVTANGFPLIETGDASAKALEDGTGTYQLLSALDAERDKLFATGAPLEGTLGRLSGPRCALLYDGERWAAGHLRLHLLVEETEGRWFAL